MAKGTIPSQGRRQPQDSSGPSIFQQFVDAIGPMLMGLVGTPGGTRPMSSGPVRGNTSLQQFGNRMPWSDFDRFFYPDRGSLIDRANAAARARGASPRQFNLNSPYRLPYYAQEGTANPLFEQTGPPGSRTAAAQSFWRNRLQQGGQGPPGQPFYSPEQRRIMAGGGRGAQGTNAPAGQALGGLGGVTFPGMEYLDRFIATGASPELSAMSREPSVLDRLGIGGGRENFIPSWLERAFGELGSGYIDQTFSDLGSDERLPAWLRRIASRAPGQPQL